MQYIHIIKREEKYWSEGKVSVAVYAQVFTIQECPWGSQVTAMGLSFLLCKIGWNGPDHL